MSYVRDSMFEWISKWGSPISPELFEKYKNNCQLLSKEEDELCFGLFYLYQQGKIKEDELIAGLSALVDKSPEEIIDTIEL